MAAPSLNDVACWSIIVQRRCRGRYRRRGRARTWPTVVGARPVIDDGGGRDAVLPLGRRGSAQASHPVPQARRLPARRGARRPGGLLLRRLAAVPPPQPHRDRQGRAGRASGGGRAASAEPPPVAAPLPDRRPAHRGRPGDRRQLLLANADVQLHFVAADRSSELYRNAVGDELVYIQAGRARFESVFGALDVGEGDYVLVPNGTTHRWTTAGGPPPRALVIE